MCRKKKKVEVWIYKIYKGLMRYIKECTLKIYRKVEMGVNLVKQVKNPYEST